MGEEVYFKLGLKGEEIKWILNLRGGSIDIGERERKFRGHSVNPVPCPMCGEDDEDIFHFLGNCKELADLRNECFSLVLADRRWVEGIVGSRVKMTLRNLAKYVDEGLIHRERCISINIFVKIRI